LHRFDPLPQIPQERAIFAAANRSMMPKFQSAIDAGEKRLNATAAPGALVAPIVIRVMARATTAILVEEVVDQYVTALGQASAAA